MTELSWAKKIKINGSGEIWDKWFWGDIMQDNWLVTLLIV